MTARTDFAAADAALRAAESAWVDAFARENAREVAEMRRVTRARRGASYGDMVSKSPAGRELHEFWTVYAECLCSIRRADLSHLEFLCAEAAEREPLPSSDDEVELDVVHRGAYGSQGYGAAKYARGAAEDVAAQAALHGVAARVVECDRGWLVLGRTTEVGARQLRHLPGPPLRDWVRACWARGTNPRVYYPWLPHGYEEREGLDFFGGEVARAAAVG